jgi:hypothetical protein
MYTAKYHMVIFQVINTKSRLNRCSLTIGFSMCSPTIVAHALRQAEETLFRVHAYFFVRDSPHFKNLLAVSEESVVATEKEVVRLDNDVRSIDFERFLTILYPRYAITLKC